MKGKRKSDGCQTKVKQKLDGRRLRRLTTQQYRTPKSSVVMANDDTTNDTLHLRMLQIAWVRRNSRKTNNRREELGLLYSHQQAKTLNKQ
jgi:hypothetical protein